MTIGPAPMSRIDSRSVALRHQATPRSARGWPAGASRRSVTPSMVGELLEQVGAVVRAGARLRVVLHAEGRRVEHPQALAHAVVEVDVAHLGAAAQRVGVDGEVVVLAGDLDLAGGQVAHGVVAAVVPERELHRRRRRGPDRGAGARGRCRRSGTLPSRPAMASAGVRHGRRVAGAVGEEHARRLRGRARRPPSWTRAPPPRRTTTPGGAGSCA